MTALVEVTGLRIGAPSDPLVDRFDLRVEAGEPVALVGPSLTGKTTVFAVLAGWTAPAAGTVRWAGAEVAPRGPPWPWCRRRSPSSRC